MSKRVGKNRPIILMLLAFLVSIVVSCEKASIQDVNVKKLLAENFDGRLVPHRVNDLDRLQEILDVGIRSFEVDLLFRSDETGNYFEVGHDERTATGVHFETFLEKLKRYEIRKIWLDIKNVRELNVDVLVLELIRLDSLFGIRTFVIVEANITTGGFQKISARGFHTSYYLPTGSTVSLLEENDPAKLRAEAERLQKQLHGQSVLAVSFDLRLYPFVKDYLEQHISDTVVYHTWNSIRLWKPGSLDDLQSQDYWRDARVKTVLYKYRSSP